MRKRGDFWSPHPMGKRLPNTVPGALLEDSSSFLHRNTERDLRQKGRLQLRRGGWKSPRTPAQVIPWTFKQADGESLPYLRAGVLRGYVFPWKTPSKWISEPNTEGRCHNAHIHSITIYTEQTVHALGLPSNALKRTWGPSMCVSNHILKLCMFKILK